MAAAAAARMGGSRSTFVRDAFLRLEGRAAPAGRLHVRVVDREARAHERVDEVDLRAGQIGSAERIDDDPDTVHLDLVVTVLGASVETERVLEPRAAAALNGDAKDLRLADARRLGEPVPEEKPVKELTTAPMEGAPIPAQPAEDVEFTGEYYPVAHKITKKDGH